MRSHARLASLGGYVAPLCLGMSAAGLLVLVRLYLIGNLGWAAGSDLEAYWGLDPSSPYHASVGNLGAFLYSPVVALAALMLHAVPFDVVRVLWWVVGFACLAWLTGRWALAWILFLPVAGDLYTGNIHLMLAAAIVLGMRWPVAWSFVLLTKVTPGIGLVWFAVRGEWRSLATVLGITAALAAASYVVVPAWWQGWLSILRDSSSGPPSGSPVLLGLPLWIRLAAAGCLVAWGARRDLPWTVPIGAMLALPTVWIISPAMLVAVPYLSRDNRLERRRAGLPNTGVPVLDRVDCVASG